MESRESFRAAKVLVVAGALVTLGVVVGFILAGNWDLSPQVQAREASRPASTLESPFTGLAERTLPAVVSIDTKRTADAGDNPHMNFEGPYGDFFRRLFPETPQTPQAPRRNMRIPSSGSGFIMDRQGHILTNNHVVRDASDITVTLSDHRKFKAKIVGTDPGTDVAVIKIDPDSDLPTVPLGDSDEVRIGDWAIAIGNALGELEGTLTVGVVSAKGRTNLQIVGGAPSYQNFIQTDASINFGNSGGPLLNIRGEAIGINTAINPTGSGIGFAIPINIARGISTQLIAHGKVTRGYLGIVPQELTPELAEMWGLKNVDGILIASISKGAPAEEAGLAIKDVITEFDGKPVDDVQKFRMLVADTPVKKRVLVRLLREGKPRDLYVTLQERPDEQLLARGEPAEPEVQLGIRVEPVTGDFATRAGIRDRDGVVIAEVAPDSPGDEAGVMRGDVIREVNDTPIKDVSGYNAAIRNAKEKNPKKPVVLLIKRGETTQFIAVEPE